MEEIRRVRDLVSTRLGEALFDFREPDISLAWSVFKKLALREWSGLESVRFVAAAYHAADRDDVLWLDFSREVEDASGASGYAGCIFARPVPGDLRAVDLEVWGEPDGVARWISDVEAHPVFTRSFELKRWRWEGAGR